MKKLATLLFLSFIAASVCGQKDSTTWTMSFPITDYVINSNDSINIVQVRLPDGHTPIPEKTIGVLRGANRNNEKDTASTGWGRCQLIKGDFYYFGLKLYPGRKPKAGDLVYVMLPKPAEVYAGRIPKIACHCINFQKVSGDKLFDCYRTRQSWTKQNETEMFAEMIADIRYTATEMRKQMPEVNNPINDGIFKGKKLFDAMEAVTEADLVLFLDYVIARPRLYAGNDWKISETYATWMTSGTPTVVKN